MNNSELRVSQTYRSSFLTQLPKVYIGTILPADGRLVVVVRR